MQVQETAVELLKKTDLKLVPPLAGRGSMERPTDGVSYQDKAEYLRKMDQKVSGGFILEILHVYQRFGG